MPFEFPKEISRTSLDGLWNDVWRIVEQLRLWEDRLGAGSSEGVKFDLSAMQKRQDEIMRAVAAARSAGGQHRIPFGSIDAGSTSTVMTATVPGIEKLEDGVAAYITNGVVTSASGWTLNVNGLGAKPVYNSMAAATRITTTYNVAYTMLFVYNSSRVAGGCWDMYYGYNSDTNTIAYNIRHYQSRRLKTKLYRYNVCFTGNDGKLVPSCTVSDSTGATLGKTLNTTVPFNPFEEIFFYTTTSTKNADAQVSASYMYMQYNAVDLGYGFNVGTSLTVDKFVYVRCAPNADGTVQLDGNDCIVQALPSTADGKAYIRLGFAYSTHQIDMSLDKPVYQYKDGKVQLWTGA